MKALILILLIFNSYYLMSQSVGRVEESSLFIYSNYSFDNNKSEFSELSGTPTCCEENFTRSSGHSYFFGLQYSKLIGSGFYLSGDFDIVYSNTEFSKSEFEDIRDPQIELAEIEHFINANVWYSSLALGLEYKFFDMRILGTFGFNIFLYGDHYRAERLLKPENYGTFENGLRTRNEFEEEITMLRSTSFFNEMKLAYDIHFLGRNDLVISPFLSYRYGFNSRINNGSWINSSLSLGIGLRLKELRALSTPLNPEQ